MLRIPPEKIRGHDAALDNSVWHALLADELQRDAGSPVCALTIPCIRAYPRLPRVHAE